MKLDKYTYGKTPAAIYLADQLNAIGRPTLARKAGKIINGIREAVKGLLEANAAGLISTTVLADFVRMKREELMAWREMTLNQQHMDEVTDDEILVTELVTNICVGELKSASRRSSEAKIVNRKPWVDPEEVEGMRKRDWQSGYYRAIRDPQSGKWVKRLVTAVEVEETITPEVLVKRSRDNLTKRGKPNTFY